MPKFLNPTGRSSYVLSRCERCQDKVFASELRSDGDRPGLKVCRYCYDKIDPWKLPPPPPDNFSVPGAKPNDILLPEE